MAIGEQLQQLPCGDQGELDVIQENLQEPEEEDQHQEQLHLENVDDADMNGDVEQEEEQHSEQASPASDMSPRRLRYSEDVVAAGQDPTAPISRPLRVRGRLQSTHTRDRKLSPTNFQLGLQHIPSLHANAIFSPM